MEHASTADESNLERRDSFRVADVLPMSFQKVASESPHFKSRVLPGFSDDFLFPHSYEETPDETVNPHLWRILLQINNRLGMILHRLQQDGEGLGKAETRAVSLSPSGVKFSTTERLETGDLLEIKMLLALAPPNGSWCMEGWRG